MKAPRLPLMVCRFTLSGLNLERFMNQLGKEELPLLSVRRTDPRTMVCRCYAADLPRIRAFARDKGWRVENETPLGLSAWLAWVKARPGVWIGALLALIAVAVALQFIWEVRLVGAGAYQADLTAYLREEGLTPGVPRAKVDAARLEQALYRRYPEIAWFHVYAYGVTLVVDCTQGVPAPSPPPTEPGDVTALRDGVVEALRVYAGTAAVAPGDTVRQGQVLIRGWERGRDGEETPVRARGVVTARCWSREAARFSLYEVESWETDRETRFYQLCTPWLCYPAAADSPNYLAYNVYHEDVPLGGAFFPLWLRRVICREAAMEYAPRDPEAVRREAEAAVFARLKTSLRGYEIIDKWVDYCMIEGDTLAVSAVAEWRMDIGQTET